MIQLRKMGKERCLRRMLHLNFQCISDADGEFLQDSFFFCQFKFWGIFPGQLLLFSAAIIFWGTFPTASLYRWALICCIVLQVRADVFKLNGMVPHEQLKHISTQHCPLGPCPLGPCLWLLRVIFYSQGISIGQERGHLKKFHSSAISEIH